MKNPKIRVTSITPSTPSNPQPPGPTIPQTTTLDPQPPRPTASSPPNKKAVNRSYNYGLLWAVDYLSSHNFNKTTRLFQIWLGLLSLQVKKWVKNWSKLFRLDYLMQSLYFKNITKPLRRLIDGPLYAYARGWLVPTFMTLLGFFWES